MERLLRPSEMVTQGHWYLSGPVSDRRVYPVQVSGAIVFTDGEAIFLKFDGWHFVEVRGLDGVHSETNFEGSVTTVFDYLVTDTFSNSSGAENLPTQKPVFSGDRATINYEVGCEAWQKVPVIGGELLSQSCSFDSEEAFLNSIWLDQSGNIRLIESVLGPRRNKVRVSMRGQ